MGDKDTYINSQGEDSSLEKLFAAGVFTLSAAKKFGISQPTISRLVSRGVLARVERGVFYSPKLDLAEPEALEWGAALNIFGGNSYIGGLTVLFRYNLVSTPPKQTWVTVPLETKTIRARYRLIRTALPLNVGVEQTKLFKIATPQRAVFDALYFAEIWGRAQAFSAAREAITTGLVTLNDLIALAKKLGQKNTITRYQDFLSPEALGLK